MLAKIKKFIKRPLYAIMLLIILGIAGFWYLVADSKKSPYQFSTVKRGDILQEVSVTGRVKPAQAVDLAFERGGKVARINVTIGDKIVAGQILAVLENGDLAAQAVQAQAGLASQQANLDALKIGTRPEEIQIARTNADNAKQTLQDAENNLTNVQNKAVIDLNNLYAAAKDTLNDAYVNADDALNKQIDDLFSSDNSANPKLTFVTGNQITSDVEWQRQTVGAAITQLKQSIDNFPDSNAGIDATLTKSAEQLKIIQDFLNALSQAVNQAAGLTSATLAAYKLGVNTGRTNVTDALTAINDDIQDIAAQKATNQTNVTIAQNSANTAANSLSSYQDQLTLKLAGSTADQINSQAAQVLSARANLANAQAQLAKTIIRSPLDGLISKQDGKPGEMVAANAPLISVMSTARFEVEANVTEVDIAKVKIGDSANITLDAYGNSVIFEAKTVKINPAETMVEGVATYKTTFQFNQEDGRVRSGMTANIDIQTAKKANVLLVPQRAVTTRDSEQFVYLANGAAAPMEKKIITGLRGSDGNWEVVSGLNEGDKIVSYGQK